jgi:hypothetical protein
MMFHLPRHYDHYYSSSIRYHTAPSSRLHEVMVTLLFRVKLLSLRLHFGRAIATATVLLVLLINRHPVDSYSWTTPTTMMAMMDEQANLRHGFSHYRSRRRCRNPHSVWDVATTTARKSTSTSTTDHPRQCLAMIATSARNANDNYKNERHESSFLRRRASLPLRLFSRNDNDYDHHDDERTIMTDAQMNADSVGHFESECTTTSTDDNGGTHTNRNGNGEDGSISLPPGKRKWLGGAITSDKSTIYGIPSNAKGVLRVHIPPPINNTFTGNGATTITMTREEEHQYHPRQSASETSSTSITMIPLPAKKYWHGKFKWLRGILAQNDRYLYGIPAWSNQGVLQVDLKASPSPKVQILPLPFSPLKRQRELLLREEKPDETSSDGDEEEQEIHENEPPQEEVDITRWMWHGAALSKDETCIICIPSNAQRVLRIDLPTACSNATLTEIGPLLDHKRNKWYGGILGDDGAIYGVPYTTKDILRVDPLTNDVQLIPVPVPTTTGTEQSDKDNDVDYYQYNWHGGTKSSINGAIYAFPSHADTVLKIDTRPNAAVQETTSQGSSSTTDNANNGETTNSSISTITHVKITKLPIERAANDDCTVTNYKWLGGSIGVDGCIYGMPSDATSVLKIDPRTDRCTTISARARESNTYRYDDPAITHSNNKPLISNEKNKYQGGVLSPRDGCIYAIPCNAQNILRIDTNMNVNVNHPNIPVEEDDSSMKSILVDENKNKNDESWRVRVVGDLPSTKDKWQGAFLGRDGSIYGIPENADRILKITPPDPHALQRQIQQCDDLDVDVDIDVDVGIDFLE